jgi:uncharacterized protein (DUF952 family)
MSVLFHIAARRDWERAERAKAYTVASLAADGFIHSAVTRPLDLLGARSLDGVPFVRPEIALLYKAKAARFKDERDFDRALPHLDAAARAWLASSLEQAHPGHPWRARL